MSLLGRGVGATSDQSRSKKTCDFLYAVVYPTKSVDAIYTLSDCESC
jgi:hypothetical protein